MMVFFDYAIWVTPPPPIGRGALQMGGIRRPFVNGSPSTASRAGRQGRVSSPPPNGGWLLAAQSAADGTRCGMDQTSGLRSLHRPEDRSAAQPVGRSAGRPPAEPTWFEPWKKAGKDSSRAASPTLSSGCPPAAVDGLRRPPREQIGHFRRCQLATIPPVKGLSGGLSDDRNGTASGRG